MISDLPTTNLRNDAPRPGLTLAKLIEVRDLLEAQRADEVRIRSRRGFWSAELRCWPRSKKRRIRRKWMRQGRVLKAAWNPPTDPQAIILLKIVRDRQMTGHCIRSAEAARLVGLSHDDLLHLAEDAGLDVQTAPQRSGAGYTWDGSFRLEDLRTPSLWRP